MTLCEMLNIMEQCVKNHSNRIRHFIIFNDALSKVLKLMELQDSTITLGVLRFFRALVARNDIHFNKFLLKHTYFTQVFEIYILNSKKSVDNMMHSSFLALITTLLSADLELVKHVTDTCSSKLETSKLASFFAPLLARSRSFVEMEIPSDEDEVLGQKRDDPEEKSSPNAQKAKNV